MKMFPHTITILNKVEDDDGVVYLPTVLEGVLYVTKWGSSRSVTGREIKDDIKCTIPFKVSIQKPFIGKLVYDNLPVDEKVKYWTLSKDDIIVKDIVSEPQLSLKQIDMLYESKLLISYVDTNDFGSIQHWQVGGS